MKRSIVVSLISLVSFGAFAQENSTAVNSFWADPLHHPMSLVYLATAFVALVIVLVGAVAIYMFRILNILTTQAEKAKAEKLGVAYTPRPTWWTRFMESMNASVPVAEEKDIELDHNYDGIKELDNHLPPWWKWLFYATIAWSLIYMAVFHIWTSMPLSIDEYENEVAYAEEQSRKLKASQPQAEIDENALTFTLDSVSFISKGKTVFMDNNCGSCHRNDGGGNTIGPNLTDEYWLHGGHVKDVFSTIKYGAVDKGMPAWGKSLSPQQVRDVTFFVMSLQGSRPANAKGPQGDILKEAIIKSDSSNVQASL